MSKYPPFVCVATYNNKYLNTHIRYRDERDKHKWNGIAKIEFRINSSGT